MADLSIQGEVVVNSEKAEGAFDRVGDKAQKMANEVSSSANKAGQAVDKIGDGADKGAEKFTRAEARMRDSIKRSTRELEMLGKTASQKFEANLEFKGLDKAKFQPFLSELRKAEEATKRAETGINSMSATAQIAGRAMALAFSGAAITGFLGKVVAVQREFDVLNSSLKTVTGSSAAAEREMAWLKDFAKETPFGLAQATQGFVKMKALGLDPTRAALTSFGNTASAMGKDLNQMIEAVADASTGEFERLKEFGIKAKKEGDNVSLTFQGVTTTIKNSAAEITQYLENIGNVSFGGAMEERAKTLDGTIAALGDTWDELFRTVSTNNVGGLIFDSVTLANGALEDATTILRAMGGAAQDAGRDTGALSTIQNGIATVFETVAVLGANLKFVLVGIGTEIGGLAAQVAQAAQFNFAGVRAIREQMVADAEAARREIDATTERILNARKAQEEYARYATRNASAATDPRRVDLGGSTPRAAGSASSGAAKAVKETISEYDKLIKKLSDELPAAAAAAEAAQMGYNKAQTEFLALAASPAWAKFTNDQRATVAALFENKIASEQSADAAKTLAKANLDAAQAREKYLTSLSTGLDKIQADIAAQIEATERMGLSKEAIAELDAAKLEMLATDLELRAIKAMDRNLDQQTYDALKKQAAAYRELGIAKKGGAAKEAALEMEKANAEAAKKAQEDWERASEQINSTLTDALMRGFESGKDFAKNLRDTVVNMFKTMVLRPVVSAIVSPVAGAITGALGLAGTANAGTSALGAIGTGASILNAGSALGGLGAVGGAIQGFGTAMLSSVQSLMGITGTTAQMVTSLTAAGHTAAAGAATGTQIFQAIPGWGWALAGGAALASIFGKKKIRDTGIEGDFGGETGFEGQRYTYSKKWFKTKTEYDPLEEETRAIFGDAFIAARSQLRQYGEILSLPIGGIDDFTSHMKLSLKGLNDQEVQEAVATALRDKSNELAQQMLGSWTSVTKEVTEVVQSGQWGDGTIQTVTRAVTESTYAASEYAKEGEKAIDTLTRLAANIQVVNGTFENLGWTLMEASLKGADAAGKFAERFGGLEGFAAAASTYYENFYSEAEKTANVTRGITAALADVGLAMPKTRAEFRALVEAQMALGESGTQAVAALLGVSGAFASITEAATLAQEQEVKAAAADRKDRLAAQRAAEKAQAEALQKQIEAYSDGAEQFNTLRDSLLKAGDAAGLLAAVTERAFADPSGKYMNGKYANPQWEATDTAASFNYRYGEMQARMRQQLGDEASANALRIENVQGVLQSYSVEQMMSEYDSVTGAVKLAVQQAIVDASGDLGYAVRDAVQGAALYAAMADVRGQFTSSGPGLASIAAARATAADASRTSIDPATGLYRIGGAAVEYGKALDNLQGRMRSGAIDADTFERAVEALGAALPGAAESVGTLEDVVSAMQGASYMVGTAGLNSIRHYFGSLSELTAEFAQAAAETQEPIAQTTAAIGRLNSAQYAFAESATATLQGFGWGGVGGAWMLKDAGVMKDVNRAQLIAEAAGIASAAMTTADAAAAAAKLAQSPAFAELTAQGIRDASLLLDGVGEYNADGFERAFIRISDALAKGRVTEDQYKALFDTALDMFEGVPEETRTLIDSMTRLRDAMSGFADGLLIDEQRTTLSAGATLAEMQRQYAQAFAGAATGDNDAIGKYQQLANTLLDKELYSTQAEYNAAFGSVYGDARQLENIGINTMANAQGNEMVSELKDMNAKLNKRVEDLEKNLLAALAQIAKNTSDTSRGIEQQIVMAEDPP